MPAPSYTYTLANATTADASKVMQDFNDILNGVTDGTKDLSINALTCAGTATFNGNVAVGNSSADTLTVTGSLISDIVPSTDGTRSLGSASLGFLAAYFGDTSGDTVKIIAATLAADRIYTLPEVSADASFVMTQGAQTIAGVKTFSDGIKVDDGGSETTLNSFIEASFTPVLEGSSATGAGTYVDQIGRYTRIGSTVWFHIYISWTTHTGTGDIRVADLPFTNSATTVCALRSESVRWSVTPASVVGYISSSGTKILLQAIRSADTAVSATFADAGNDDATPTKYIQLNGVYRV